MSLPSAFPPLSQEEAQQEWAKELLIGEAFAREFDLYRAITCYKRALILMPGEVTERHLQMTYDLLLCYYLGNKYQEAINLFELSELSQVNSLFPAYDNLLLILHDSYRHLNQNEKADCIFELIQQQSPDKAENLALLTIIKSGDIDQVSSFVYGHPKWDSIQTDLDLYHQYAKSPRQARFLNACLPGAGYYYLGQRNTAVTAFIINTLFIAAAYQFFHRGYVAAGAITTSLEMGWYIGGINGVGLEAQEFNTRLFEGVGRSMLLKEQSFPILMFETAF
jgi:tetratricopeptide (TPR) repeat protein